MGRVLIIDALVFLVPFAAYGAWLYLTRGSLTNVEDWQARTIGFLAIAGAGSLLLALVVFTHYNVIPPGGTYRPAHIEGGKIVPGRTEPDSADPG